MKAMALTRFGLRHVDPVEIDRPVPGPTGVLVKVLACGVCRTDLHVIDGELPNPTIPVVPGHEIVGRIEAVGGEVTALAPGTRVGIPWLGRSIRSVANLTRKDAREFLALAAELPLRTHVHGYALTDANRALADLRSGRLSGAAVLVP